MQFVICPKCTKRRVYITSTQARYIRNGYSPPMCQPCKDAHMRQLDARFGVKVGGLEKR